MPDSAARLDATPIRLGRAAARGVVWTASSQTIRQIVQVAVTAILARHLAPADFGLVGMAAVTLAFVAPLNELGMGAALVQRKDLGPGHASTVFWCQVLIAMVIAALLVAAAPMIAAFFRRPDLVPLLRVLCCNLPLGAAASAPMALLTRDLRFGRIAAIETLGLIVAGSIGAALAIGGFGVWSLAAQSLAATGLTSVLLACASGIRPVSRRTRPSRMHLRDLVHVSLPLTGFQWLNFLSRNVDDILIGRFLGAGALGYYQLAYRIMMYPLQKVSDVLGRVTFPAFASMQDDVQRMRAGYLRTVRYIGLVTFPMMAVVIVAAPEFTRVLFGPSWAPVAPLVAVLSLAGMAGSIGTTVGTLCLARGRADVLLKWEVLALACYAAAIGFGLQWGLLGVVIAYTLTQLILWPILHLVTNRLIDLSMRELFAALLPQGLLAAGLALALLALKLLWRPESLTGQTWFLAVSAAAGAATLVVAALTGWPAAAGEALALVREALGVGPGRREAR